MKEVAQYLPNRFETRHHLQIVDLADHPRRPALFMIFNTSHLGKYQPQARRHQRQHQSTRPVRRSPWSVAIFPQPDLPRLPHPAAGMLPGRQYPGFGYAATARRGTALGASKREEGYLVGKFGEPYLTGKNSTNRWFRPAEADSLGYLPA